MLIQPNLPAKDAALLNACESDETFALCYVWTFLLSAGWLQGLVHSAWAIDEAGACMRAS